MEGGHYEPLLGSDPDGAADECRDESTALWVLQRGKTRRLKGGKTKFLSFVLSKLNFQTL